VQGHVEHDLVLRRSRKQTAGARRASGLGDRAARPDRLLSQVRLRLVAGIYADVERDG
jgi:hypothetical protein